MVSLEEQRYAIKFCVKLCKSASETLQMIRQAYQDDALSRTTVYEWHRRFSEGRESIADDARRGRPRSSRTEAKITSVHNMLKEDRRTTIRMLAEQLHIDKETVRLIIHEDLRKRKLCARFVPHTLTPEQKEDRITACRDLLGMIENDTDFLTKIITGDESWCFAYDPETKRQSAEWVGNNSPRPKKLRFQKSRVKTMLVTFFDCKGIIHREFVPQGQTVNAAFYQTVMERLLKRIARVRPEMFKSGNWFLLHDNAPAHNATLVRQFLARKNVTVLHHPPYSPDLAPADYFLFPKLKLKLKGRRFDDIATIQKSVTEELNTLTADDFKRCIERLQERATKCIELGGVYVEN